MPLACDGAKYSLLNVLALAIFNTMSGDTPGNPRTVRSAGFHGIVGNSRAIRDVCARVEKIAPVDSPVLIQGETGTGKDVVARAVHRLSTRAAMPFGIVDCACFTANLLESELFGHAKGAFTGAHEARAGAIESANGGTLFLDEIGEVPLELQSRLLRVLESRTIRRVGESFHRPVDVRFVFATHRDLRAMVADGRFRQDLYFRIAVLSVTVPPLRDRLEDIPLLVAHFRGPHAPPLDASTQTLFVGRAWPGNVRELRNLLERVSALGAEGAMTQAPPAMAAPVALTPLPLHAPTPLFDGASGIFDVVQTTPRPSSPLSPMKTAPDQEGIAFDSDLPTFRQAWMEIGERAYLSRLLVRANGDVPRAAELAGVNKTYIYRLMRKHRTLEQPSTRNDKVAVPRASDSGSEVS